jgi:AraC-like DNA-binding protein
MLDANELVFQLGYTDQSHLLREFKRYHGITPAEAINFAFGNEKETMKISEQS